LIGETNDFFYPYVNHSSRTWVQSLFFTPRVHEDDNIPFGIGMAILGTWLGFTALSSHFLCRCLAWWSLVYEYPRPGERRLGELEGVFWNIESRDGNARAGACGYGCVVRSLPLGTMFHLAFSWAKAYEFCSMDVCRELGIVSKIPSCYRTLYLDCGGWPGCLGVYPVYSDAILCGNSRVCKLISIAFPGTAIFIGTAVFYVYGLSDCHR
jgi:hypothetical protein